MIKDDEFNEHWEENEKNSKSAVPWFLPEKKAGLCARAIKEGVTRENLPAWLFKIAEAHPAALKEKKPALPADATPYERLADANGDTIPPRARPRPKRNPSERSVWDVLEKQKAEAEAKAEKIRNTRNPWRKKP